MLIFSAVIPAQGVAGVSHSMLCACATVGLCRNQRALQGGIYFEFSGTQFKSLSELDSVVRRKKSDSRRNDEAWIGWC